MFLGPLPDVIWVSFPVNLMDSRSTALFFVGSRFSRRRRPFSLRDAQKDIAASR
jgi:hypothetical protein